MSAKTTPSAWLEFPSGERHFLQEGMTTIGRAPTNRIILATERVSRNHAVIRRDEEGGFTLMDLGSSNGTFVNGQPVKRPLKLGNGWIVEVGLQKMTFRVTEPSGATSEAAQPVMTPCWLLALSATVLGCRTPGEELADKTFESWSERAQRVIAKSRGRTMRARDEGIIAYWPVQSNDTQAAAVASALRSLSAARRKNEEFRLSLHYGPVSLKPSPTGENAPFGPEVIFVVQLDRLASTINAPLLLTEPARDALGAIVPTRRLGQEELRSYSGDQRFYTLADSAGEAVPAAD